MLDNFKFWAGMLLASFLLATTNIFILEGITEIKIDWLYRNIINWAAIFIYVTKVERGRPKFIQNACEIIGGLISDLFRFIFVAINILMIFAGPALSIIGFFYWLWLSYEIGSFWMFVVGITPLAIITIPIGAWSIFFGAPDWVLNIFG